jgi:hypothetical protein
MFQDSRLERIVQHTTFSDISVKKNAARKDISSAQHSASKDITI